MKPMASEVFFNYLATLLTCLHCIVVKTFKNCHNDLHLYLSTKFASVKNLRCQAHETKQQDLNHNTVRAINDMPALRADGNQS